MPFAQLSFKQKVGNSNLGIDEAGCYVDAFCNLLEKVGVAVDPPTLNTFFTDHKVYTYDKTDRANDDLYWNSGTRYCPQLVVAQIGGAGFPNLDLAIVEFHYRSVQHPTLPNGQPNMITHFCAVNHVADHSIIDSWDGKVKTPVEYEHVYGQPIAWATYVYHTVQTTPVSLPPAAPVSAPKAQAPAPQPPAPAAPKQIVLPKTDHYYLWHVYNTGGPWTLPHAIGALDPYHYGPLTYDILGNPAPNIYLIKTQSFGEVAIYAGPDTVAQFPGTGHGEGEDTTLPAPPVASIPVSEVVPAPTSAPVTPTITYAAFDAPMQLVTKEGAKSYNFALNMPVVNYQPSMPFEAVGKATVTNSDGSVVAVYFMDSDNFQADNEAQRQPVGIKTGDLSNASKPELATATTGTADTITVHSSSTASSVPITTSSTSASGPAVPEPALPWQRSMKFFESPVAYVTRKSTRLFDFPSGDIVREFPERVKGEIVGKFGFAGAFYWRTKQSLDEGTWQGFPVADLERENASNTPFDTNDDINQLGYELDTITKTKHAVLKAGGAADGFLARFKRQRSM